MKASLEWFKLDVHLDDKFQLIEAEYGLKGFAVVVKLLQKIYGGEGYYCEWTDEVALLFSRKECGEGGNVVSDIVASAIKRGIFDKESFDRYHILTSAGIQKRYLEAVNRRKDSKIKDEYLLINCTQKSENDDISGENVDISGENVDISQQKRREEKRKDNPPIPPKGKNTQPTATDADFERFWKAYPNKTGKEYARKCFVKVTENVNILIEAVERQKTWDKWIRDGGRYIPNPSTWLNQKRWEDKPPQEAKPRYM